MNLANKLLSLFIAFFLSGLTAFGQTNQSVSVIPKPVSMDVGQGSFTIDKHTVIVADTKQDSIKNIALQLKQAIDSATGYDIAIIAEPNNSDSAQFINFHINARQQSGDSKEGYQLSVTEANIDIKAANSDGLFYGMQTLLQLLPAQIYQTDYTLVPQDTEWSIPVVEITDYPRFEYRGMHMDVRRH